MYQGDFDLSQASEYRRLPWIPMNLLIQICESEVQMEHPAVGTFNTSHGAIYVLKPSEAKPLVTRNKHISKSKSPDDFVKFMEKEPLILQQQINKLEEIRVIQNVVPHFL